MERDLIARGYTSFTLGVEPSEVKNMMIYFKWGVVKHVKTDYEVFPNGDKIILSYYKKDYIDENSDLVRKHK